MIPQTNSSHTRLNVQPSTHKERIQDGSMTTSDCAGCLNGHASCFVYEVACVSPRSTKQTVQDFVSMAYNLSWMKSQVTNRPLISRLLGLGLWHSYSLVSVQRSRWTNISTLVGLSSSNRPSNTPTNVSPWVSHISRYDGGIRILGSSLRIFRS